MRRLTTFGALGTLAACATDPIYTVPPNQTVADYVAVSQLESVGQIRKGNKDSWQYVNDRYVIYRGNHDYLVEFRHNCGDLTDNAWVPADYIHDHRNLRAGQDTIRGCIVQKIYPITSSQRAELRNIGGSLGQSN